MAWPFGSSDKSGEPQGDLSEERLKIMSSIAIEQVPATDIEGKLTEEEAWTISPGPTRARLNSSGSLPTAASAAPAQGQANIDTSGLEKLITSRIDQVEDMLRKVDNRLEDGIAGSAGEHSPEGDSDDGAGEGSESGSEGQESGEKTSATETDSQKSKHVAPLLELYEAQALASNPFLKAPAHLGEGADGSVGAPTVAALLLDNLSGMAAVSFTQKAMSSGMLSADEGRLVLAIVQMAAPGDTESALEDHLPHRDLLTFSALISNWRRARSLRGEE